MFTFALILACGLAPLQVQGGLASKREARQAAPEDVVGNFGHGLSGDGDDIFYRGGYGYGKREASPEPEPRKRGSKRKSAIRGASQGAASTATSWVLDRLYG